MLGWEDGSVGYHSDDGRIFDPESIPDGKEAHGSKNQVAWTHFDCGRLNCLFLEQL